MKRLAAQPGHQLVGVLRLRIGAPEADAIEASDRLLYIRPAGH